MNAPGKTAFIFTGGGSLGAVQVGMLKALLHGSVQAELVAGVSVGAINAFCFACQPDAVGVARLEAIWRLMRRADIFPSPSLRESWRILRGRGHLLSAHGLEHLLRTQLPAQELAATRIPCLVIAADAMHGTAVTLARGAALPALIASAAIPALFPPVQIDGQILIDGGFAYQAPFESVVAAGATRIYVLPTGYTCALSAVPHTALGRALHTLNLMMVSKLIGSIRHYSQQCEIRIVPPLCPLDISPLNFSRTAELIERAEAQTTTWLRQGTEMDEGLPHQLAPHQH
jgi:NTE family protein